MFVFYCKSQFCKTSENFTEMVKCSDFLSPPFLCAFFFRQPEQHWPSIAQTWVIPWAKKMTLLWLSMARLWSTPFPLKCGSPFWISRCHARLSSAVGKKREELLEDVNTCNVFLVCYVSYSGVHDETSSPPQTPGGLLLVCLAGDQTELQIPSKNGGLTP